MLLFQTTAVLDQVLPGDLAATGGPVLGVSVQYKMCYFIQCYMWMLCK